MLLRRLQNFLQTSSNFITKRAFMDDKPHFAGSRSQYTTEMSFLNPTFMEGIPVYRVLDCEGVPVVESNDPGLDKDMLVKMMKSMTFLHIFDRLMSDAQRQGRITFYVTNFGEEGAQIGSAAAVDKDDMVYCQYRETGVFLWRGYTSDQIISQCYGNKNDGGKGRQMPIHYGSSDLNLVTISSPLATQIPQSVGTAYAYKIAKNGQCALCYFGEGTASEGDAHAGINFAAALDCPVIFFCRNNGYAISTPTSQQYKGDGIASRGIAFGLKTIRIDGNDIFAVYNATKAAREICLTENRPVLIEAMTYRVGSHSTGDDGLAYRSSKEVNYWDEHDNPILRLKHYLINKGYWSDQEEKEWLKESRQKIIKEIKNNEKVIFSNPMILFEDVYDKMPPRLHSQMKRQYAFINKNRQHYPSNFDPVVEVK